MGEHGDLRAVEPPPAPDAPPPARRRRRPVRLIVTAALLAALVVAGGVFLLLREDPLTLDGRYVTDPAAVLADADRVLADYVEGRHGARSEDSRCWFQLRADDGPEVQDTLLCGPALFVDGDPARVWLRFPLRATPDGGDVRLAVADLPVDPAPESLTDPDRLHRPGLGGPPSGSGGLQVPEPPRVEPGSVTVGPFADVQYTPPPGPARLSGPAASVTVTGLAAPDRIGAGDDARRPAEGERFVAASYVFDGGEGVSTEPPTAAYVVDGGAPVPVDPALIGPGRTVEVVLSVPAEARSVDLVVTDAGTVQRLSLLTGAPGPENLAVLARTNRSVELDRSQRLEGTLSAPGRVSASFPFTVTVGGGTLQWFAGVDRASRPSGPDRALLVVDVSLAIPGVPAGAVPLELLSLSLPGGADVAPVDLSDDPDRVLVAFDVPADLTSGVLTVGGAATFPDGSAVDFGAGELEFRLEVPAG